MSDLVALILDFVSDGIIEVIHVKRNSTAVRIILYFALFSIVTGLLVLSYVNREHKPLFYIFSITGSLLGISLLISLKDFSKGFNRKSK